MNSEKPSSRNAKSSTLGIQLLPICSMGILPFLGFMDHNKTELLDYTRLAVTALIFITAVAGCFIVLRKFLKPAHHGRIAAVISVSIPIIFNCHLIDVWLKSHGVSNARYSLMVWAIAFLAVAALVWFIARSSRSLMVIAIMALGMMAVPLANTLLYQFQTASRQQPSDTPAAPRFHSQKASGPNVYFIVIDAYSRADRLKTMFNFENGEFLENLRARGFIIAEKSVANYPITTVSISSTLDMKYQILPEAKSKPNHQGLSVKMAGFNSTVDEFKSRGYRYIHFSSAWKGSVCRGAEDICIRTPQHGLLPVIEQQDWALLAMTPLEIMLKAAGVELMKRTSNTFARFRSELSRFGPSPFFSFYHNLDVHSSKVSKDCQVIGFGRLKPDAAGEERHDHVHAIQCANKEALATIDAILARDQDAIVILQSDHGLGGAGWNARVAKAGWTHDDFLDRFGILNAIRMPRNCNETVYQTMTPINTFRLVFACIDKRKPQLLEDRSYVMDYSFNAVELWDRK